MFITCGCTKIKQNYEPENKKIDPSYFNRTKEIASFKVFALSPVLLLFNMIMTSLVGLYFEYYTKPLLIQSSTNTKAVTEMNGCFDQYVNSEITVIDSIFKKNIDALD